MFAAARDVTERRRVEEELERANDELRRRNAELDEFTYVASHDLQEPLRKLTTFSSLLPGDSGHDLPEKAREDLDYITDAAQRMQSLIQDLLTLSRTGKSAMQRARVSLSACVDRALEVLARQPEVDEARLAVTGVSQGGGITIAAAALSDRPKLAMPDIPVPHSPWLLDAILPAPDDIVAAIRRLASY